jgi:alpha-glucosidase
MLDVLHFWLKRDVHGFRVDVLDRLLKDEQFRDDPPNPRYTPGDPAYMQLSTTHSAGQPGVLDIVGDMRAVLASYPGDRVLIGEIYQPVETLVAFYGDEGRGVHLPFNFNLMWLAWKPQGVMQLVQNYEAALPSGAWPTWVLGNHDQTRIATRLGHAQARVAMMLLLTLRGTPTIDQGDELGLVDTPIPADQMQDPFASAGPGQGRDPERTPMPWDDTPHSGFSAVEPWLPIGAENARRSVAKQDADPASHLLLTRSLLDLRRREPALQAGSWRGLHADDAVIVYERALGDGRIIVALNMRSSATHVSLDVSGAEVLLSTHDMNSPRRTGHRLALKADEGVIMRADA